MQPYAKKSRSTSSEPAISALAPQQGTSEDFSLSATPFHFFSHVGFTVVVAPENGMQRATHPASPPLATGSQLRQAAQQDGSSGQLELVGTNTMPNKDTTPLGEIQWT